MEPTRAEDSVLFSKVKYRLGGVFLHYYCLFEIVLPEMSALCASYHMSMASHLTKKAERSHSDGKPPNWM